MLAATAAAGPVGVYFIAGLCGSPLSTQKRLLILLGKKPGHVMRKPDFYLLFRALLPAPFAQACARQDRAYCVRDRGLCRN
jgi:hypothetical protein